MILQKKITQTAASTVAARKTEVSNLKDDLQTRQNQLVKQQEKQLELKGRLQQVKTDTSSMESKSQKVF